MFWMLYFIVMILAVSSCAYNKKIGIVEGIAFLVSNLMLILIIVTTMTESFVGGM